MVRAGLASCLVYVSWEARNGRRFLVFAGLASDGNNECEDLARAVVQTAGKALVLAPTVDKAIETASTINPA